MESPDALLRFIPLATLGDSWGLVRREMSASGAVGGHFDVGAYEIVDVAVYGTDERGRLRHVEIFATERLGAAIVRLYERYAESLPDGPASTRARAIARSLAVFDGPIEFDRIANAYAPSFEAVDRRILGTWSAQGREEALTHWRGQLGLADDSGGRYDEVLALEPGAILVHQSFWGSSRTSGGVFEVVTLVLQVFDGDGLIARTELFEPDREAEALARFAALTADAVPRPPVRRRLRPNAATASAARFEAAIAVRDEAALADVLAETLAVVDHPNGADYGRDGVLDVVPAAAPDGRPDDAPRAAGDARRVAGALPAPDPRERRSPGRRRVRARRDCASTKWTPTGGSGTSKSSRPSVPEPPSVGSTSAMPKACRKAPRAPARAGRRACSRRSKVSPTPIASRAASLRPSYVSITGHSAPGRPRDGRSG